MSINEYFEAKKRLYPQSVKGKIRKIKSILNFVFLSIYLFSPFIRFNRGENAPNQAILIDLPNSKAYFFGIEMWPDEVYYLMAILISAAVILFFITSLFGRIWCGYACFQTVWSDIFYLVEKIFQGDRNSRLLLDRKNSFEKFYKKFLTHFVWILISLITGYTFVSYFNDAFLLLKNFYNFNLSFAVLAWILGIAAATYIMAGFAREHVCTFMCPYSRFQSAMFDRDTLIITYDEKRGEPRGKHKQGESFDNRGHCIDCKQCVVVCPVGIDIRNGLQMECIACGLCIDACDNIMEKIGLPKGLIRYDTEAHLQKPTAENKFRFFKPRTFYYATILLIVGSFMLFNLTNKTLLKITAIPDRNPLFVKLSDGSIRNGYTLKIANKTYQDKVFSIKLIKPQNAEIKIESYQGIDAEHLLVKAQEVSSFKIYIALSQEFLSSNTEERILLEALIKEVDGSEEEKIEMIFVAR